MDIKLPKIKFLNITDWLKSHVVLMWSILAILLLTYAGYIFYLKAYIPTNTTPIPLIKPVAVQKDKLDKIIQDLLEREQNRNEFSSEKTVDPFYFQP